MRATSLDYTPNVMTTAAAVTPNFLRLDDVMRMTGLARSTLYRLITRGEFPAPCRLGPRAVGWRSTDITQWIASRPSARS